MPPEYTVNLDPTSARSAKVADIPLRDPAAEPDALTRRILRPLMVENARDAAAPIKACIMHQRRHSIKSPWEDADSFNLATLKAGQEVRLTLDCDETLRLSEA